MRTKAHRTQLNSGPVPTHPISAWNASVHKELPAGNKGIANSPTSPIPPNVLLQLLSPLPNKSPITHHRHTPATEMALEPLEYQDLPLLPWRGIRKSDRHCQSAASPHPGNETAHSQNTRKDHTSREGSRCSAVLSLPNPFWEFRLPAAPWNGSVSMWE